MTKKYIVPKKNPIDITITISSNMKLLLGYHENFSGLKVNQILEKVYMKDYVLTDELFLQYLESRRDNVKVMEVINELKRVKRAFELLEEEENRNRVA